MAYSDYNQSQIIEQIQAFFLMKRLADENFLKGTTFDPINGKLGGPDSLTGKAIDTYLRQRGLAGDINPGNPDYLAQVHRVTAQDLAADNNAQYHIGLLEKALESNPDSLSADTRRLLEERLQLQQKIKYGREEVEQITRDVEAGRRKDYGNASTINYQTSISVIKLDKLEHRLLEIKEIEALQKDPQKQEMYKTAQTLTTEGKNAPETNTTEKRQEHAQKPAAPLQADDHSIYFISNFVLNNPNFSIHSAHAWHSMKADGLGPGEAIDNYVKNYAARYSATHDGASFSATLQNNMKNQMIGEIQNLRNIEVSIQGIQPTPEQIAANYLETHVLPSMHGATRTVFHAMREKGVSFDDAMERYTGIQGGQKTEISEQVKNELLAADKILEAVAKYEAIELSPEDTVKIMRESWAEVTDLPHSVDHYAGLLEQKIAHYQTAEGGSLDPQTASARAAVDLRGQVDRDRGVPPRMVVDENHVFYQNDLLIMEGWLRKKMYVEQGGGITPEDAQKLGINERDMANASDLDVYSQRYGGAYGLYRRENMEDTMLKAHQQAQLELKLETKAEASVTEPEPQVKTEPPAEKETAETKVETETEVEVEAADKSQPPAQTSAQTAVSTVDMTEAAQSTFSNLQTAYLDLLGSNHSVSLEQMKFIKEATDRYDTVKNTVEAGGDPAQILKESHELASFVQDRLDQQEISFVQNNWKQLHPYIQRIDETVGPQDFEKGRDILRTHQRDIIDDTYNHRGASVRELLRDRNAFDKIDEPLQAFEEQSRSIKTLAAAGGVTLESPDSATTPATAKPPENQDVTISTATPG